jgi:hypothetical protein
LAVIAAEQYASRLVVPQSQRSHPTHWGSHNDRGAKALAKLAKPHLPASLAQLQNAVEQAHRDSSAVQRSDHEDTPEGDELADETTPEDLED